MGILVVFCIYYRNSIICILYILNNILLYFNIRFILLFNISQLKYQKKFNKESELYSLLFNIIRDILII